MKQICDWLAKISIYFVVQRLRAIINKIYKIDDNQFMSVSSYLIVDCLKHTTISNHKYYERKIQL